MGRRTTIILSSTVALVALATIIFVARNTETRTLDAATRSAAPGKFITLRDGITQYDLTGPDSARTIVLLSGATVPYYLWDPTREALVANGFRVLRYNYFGRGLSDRPSGDYDLAMYDRQLSQLLDSLGIRDQVDVAGISMGAVVGSYFADRHTDRVRSLTLVDPGFTYGASTPFPLGIPGVGEYLAATVLAPGLAESQLGDFVHPERHPEWTALYQPQMQYRGFRRAILRTIRGDAFKRSAASFVTLARSGIPMMIVWGKADHTVPFTRSDTVRAAFPRAEFHAVDDAGHLPQIEQPAKFDSLLVGFLRR
jgi:pimeloyl-ACP methyl ester carboxylesterase